MGTMRSMEMGMGLGRGRSFFFLYWKRDHTMPPAHVREAHKQPQLSGKCPHWTGSRP
jgi:hypothetical protein